MIFGTLNKEEKDLVGASSVIVKTSKNFVSSSILQAAVDPGCVVITAGQVAAACWIWIWTGGSNDWTRWRQSASASARLPQRAALLAV